MEPKVLFPKQNKSTHCPEVSFPKWIFVFWKHGLVCFLGKFWIERKWARNFESTQFRAHLTWPFLTWFQKEGPLIHLLHYELCDLYRTVLLSFLSDQYVGSTFGGALLDIDFKLAEKQLTTKMLQIGKFILSSVFAKITTQKKNLKM